MRMSRKSGAFFMWRSPGLKTSSIFFTPPSGQTVTPSSGYSVLPGSWERSRVSFSKSGGGGGVMWGGEKQGAGGGAVFLRFFLLAVVRVARSVYSRLTRDRAVGVCVCSYEEA